MKVEQWMSLIDGDTIVTNYGEKVQRTVIEYDGKIGWNDGNGVWHERGYYNMIKWDKK